MKYLRWLLFPFSLLYGLVVIIRNWCYDSGIFKSHRFNKPVICIGNLDVGGAGKTPMAEYLIRLLKNDHKIATLSRGYGRETSGFVEIESKEARVKNREPGEKSQFQETRPLAATIGDEPAQFHYKFPENTVAVCEKRVEGINKLLPGQDVILLDDAFQHRAVSAGLNILLFDYNRVDEPHLLLPAGNLREPFSGRWRAQVIIVTKCPIQLTAEERQHIANKIDSLPYQQLFFTSVAYGRLQDMAGQETDITIDKETTVFLLTGIASAAPLLLHLRAVCGGVVHHKYADHHRFTPKNIAKLAGEYRACASQKKIIVTTEKDAMRLEGSWFNAAQGETGKPAFYILPIQVEFLDEGGPRFDQLIIDYVRACTTNDGVY